MLLSISILRNSRSFTVFSVTPLSIFSNCSSENSSPATAAAECSMSLVRASAASDGFPCVSETRASANLPQSTPGKSVEVKPSEEKYARNERRSVVKFMSKGNILHRRREFVYCDRVVWRKRVPKMESKNLGQR